MAFLASAAFLVGLAAWRGVDPRAGRTLMVIAAIVAALALTLFLVTACP